MRSRRGFTLTEVMMVILIIGILAAMALPSYNKTVERQIYRGAQDMLQTLYAGEQVYHTVNNTYRNFPPAGDPAWQTELYVDDPNQLTPQVQYGIAGVTATTFTITATRFGGTCCDGDTLTIDQDRASGGTWPGSLP